MAFQTIGGSIAVISNSARRKEEKRKLRLCKQALRVLTGVFCDCADLLPQVLLAFPHAVA